MPKLVVIEGPNRGALLRLFPDRNRLGRDGEAELALPDESVSRLHAEIVFRSGAYAVRDVDSKNGTWLNGVRVAGEGPLAHGDEVRVGATTLVFLDDDAPGADPRGGETATLGGEKKLESREPAPVAPRPGRFVGESAAILKVSAVVGRCAPLDSTILITGESGTGKELVAEGLHRLSPRRKGPFLAVNCATLEPRLLESDLFGHERGAFTGAVARRLGKLELARSGTLFLDEVGELPLEAQAKLLRAIEKREFQRVGGSELLKTDARIVAATNRDLAALVKEARFRDDLRYRLAVVEIHVPPLRERREDVRPLVEHFVSELRARIPSRARGFSPEAIARLERGRFPGNVRELRNLVERCLIFAESELVGEHELPLERPTPEDGIASLEEVERRHIARTLELLAGNKTRAAETLGIDRATLYAKIKKYGLPS